MHILIDDIDEETDCLNTFKLHSNCVPVTTPPAAAASASVSSTKINTSSKWINKQTIRNWLVENYVWKRKIEHKYVQRNRDKWSPKKI